MEVIKVASFKVAIFKVENTLHLTIIEQNPDVPFLNDMKLLTLQGEEVKEVINNKVNAGEFPELYPEGRTEPLQFRVDRVSRSTWADDIYIMIVK